MPNFASTTQFEPIVLGSLSDSTIHILYNGKRLYGNSKKADRC